jgi:hypothetical protein
LDHPGSRRGGTHDGYDVDEKYTEIVKI